MMKLNPEIWESWLGSTDLWFAATNDVAGRNEWNMIPHPGNPQTDSIKEPRAKDIIYGRGTGNHNHHGNIVLRRRVKKLLRHHSSLKKSGRTKLIRNLTEDLLSKGVRFLKKEEGGQWHVVDKPKELHEKVSHCFRTMKREQNSAGTRIRIVPV